MAQRTCGIDGCERPHEAKGLCHRHYNNAWYHAHAEQARASQAAHRETTRAADRERAEAWRVANPDRARAARHAWYAEHADQVREYKRLYRDANRDKIRTSNNRRKAMQRGVEVNDLTADQWTGIKAAFGQRCAYCGRKPCLLTMDHVVPLSKGGHHTAANIVPACQTCNSRKNDGPPPTFQPLLA